MRKIKQTGGTTQMTSHFSMTRMTQEQLDKELAKAKRRLQKAKEDIGIIKSFQKLKSLESESQKLKPENREIGKPETKKPEKLADGYLDLGTANFVDD